MNEIIKPESPESEDVTDADFSDLDLELDLIGTEMYSVWGDH